MFTLDTFATFAFKILNYIGHTSNDRDPANEPYFSNIILSSMNIWADNINPVPGHADNTGIVSSLITFDLDTVSGTDNTGIYSSYVCKLGSSVPASLIGKTNRLTGLTYAAYDRVGDVIPSFFGSGFRPILYDNGSEVYSLDACDWVLDFASGIITQETDEPTSMVDFSANGTVTGYVYIGDFVIDSLSTIDGGDFV